jgi:hypothetical protein
MPYISDEQLNCLKDAAETGLMYARWAERSGVHPHTDATGKLQSIPRVAVLQHIKRIEDAIGEVEYGGRMQWLSVRLARNQELTPAEKRELASLVSGGRAYASA